MMIIKAHQGKLRLKSKMSESGQHTARQHIEMFEHTNGHEEYVVVEHTNEYKECVVFDHTNGQTNGMNVCRTKCLIRRSNIQMDMKSIYRKRLMLSFPSKWLNQMWFRQLRVKTFHHLASPLRCWPFLLLILLFFFFSNL